MGPHASRGARIFDLFIRRVIQSEIKDSADRFALGGIANDGDHGSHCRHIIDRASHRLFPKIAERNIRQGFAWLGS
jgi:hypothetical protein